MRSVALTFALASMSSTSLAQDLGKAIPGIRGRMEAEAFPASFFRDRRVDLRTEEPLLVLAAWGRARAIIANELQKTTPIETGEYLSDLNAVLRKDGENDAVFALVKPKNAAVGRVLTSLFELREDSFIHARLVAEARLLDRADLIHGSNVSQVEKVMFSKLTDHPEIVGRRIELQDPQRLFNGRGTGVYSQWRRIEKPDEKFAFFWRLTAEFYPNRTSDGFILRVQIEFGTRPKSASDNMIRRVGGTGEFTNWLPGLLEIGPSKKYQAPTPPRWIDPSGKTQLLDPTELEQRQKAFFELIRRIELDLYEALTGKRPN
jgi:hypothetical protein